MSSKLARRAMGGGVLAAGLLIGGAALAGDSNSVSILQNGSGNSLFTDQSQVSNSTLGLGPNNPLVQAGTGNTASIIVSPGASSPMTPALSSAFLNQSPDSSGVGNNTAHIHIVGVGSVGSVTQTGNGNNASLTVNLGGQGAIEQIGDRNTAGLVVSGVNVLYRQIGSNLSTATAGVSVPPGTIPTITIASSTLPTLPSGASQTSTAPIVITQSNAP
jgi:hypothetical protein